MVALSARARTAAALLLVLSLLLLPAASTVTAGQAPDEPAAAGAAAAGADPLTESGRWEWYTGGWLSEAMSVDGQFVVAAGDGVWISTNNGVSWQRTPVYGGPLAHVSFADRDHGVVAGAAAGQLFTTADGGATWHAVLPPGRWENGRFEVGGPDLLVYSADRFTDGCPGEYMNTSVWVSTDKGVTWNDRVFTFSAGAGSVTSLVAYGSTAWLFVAQAGGLLDAAYRSVDGGATWEPAAWLVSGAGGAAAVHAHDAALGSATHGWMVGTYVADGQAVLAQTTDGGETWTEHSRLDKAPAWVQAAGPDTAWYWLDGVLYRTTDGGLTWQDLGASTLKSARFRTPTEGWAVAGDWVMRTNNGGSTWAPAFIRPARQSAWYLDHLTGWRVKGTVIERTTDGGATWAGGDTGLAAVDDFKFVDALNGWAWHKASLRLAHTTDGGLTWTLQKAGVDVFHSLQFVDAQTGFVMNSVGQVRRTTDGGVSWEDVADVPAPPDDGSPWGRPAVKWAYFLDGQHGWAGGDRCHYEGPAEVCDPVFVTRTTDGGLTWSAPAAGPRRSVTFTDPLHGWGLQYANTCPGGFVVQRTTDGGLTWQDAGGWAAGGDPHLLVADAARLWAVAGGQSLFSGDGGESWTPQRSESPVYGPWRLDGAMQGFSGGSRYRNTEVLAYRAARPPRVDGVLLEWAGVPAYSLKAESAVEVAGAAPVPLDSSATVRAAWDDDYLYFAVQVFDDKRVVDSPGTPWLDDAVELGLDGRHDHQRRWNLGSASDDRQFTVDALGNLFESGEPATSARVARGQTPGGYAIEIAIPRDELGGLALAAGRLIGFNFALVDDDDGGNRDSRLAWLDFITYQANANWGQVRLAATEAPLDLRQTWLPLTRR